MFSSAFRTRSKPVSRIVTKTLWRLDFRSPSVIYYEGFTGSQNTWMNSIFGTRTIFCANSLRGLSRFYMESVMNKFADGRSGSGPLASHSSLYSKKHCYVYKIKSVGLESVDVSSDLDGVIRSSMAINSRLFNYCSGNIIEENKEKTEEELDDILFNERMKLNRYRHNCAEHTGEVIVKGPIDKRRIELYQIL